jgi:hypothetical protein
MTDPEELHTLAWKNRRHQAEREAWPAAALKACEEIEREHPAWYPLYSPREGQYTAIWRVSSGRAPRAEADTPDALRLAIANR